MADQNNPTTIPLAGYLYFTMQVDGAYLPAGLPNWLQKVEIIENAAFTTPMIHLFLIDSQNMLQDEYKFSTANKISLGVAQNADDLKNLETYRLFSHDTKTADTGQRFKIYGQLDAPWWTAGIERKSYNDTASNVLQKLAQKAGLKVGAFEQTSDQQLWINPGITTANFAQKIANYSYLSSSALLKLAIKSDSSAILVDVVKALSQKPKATFVHGDLQYIKGDYMVREIKQRNSSGFLGSWMANGYNLYDARLDGKSYKSDGIQLQTNGDYAPLNQDVYGKVTDGVRQDYAPLSAGNTGDTYWQAYHANMRKSSLFSQSIVVLIDSATTKVGLLDTVELKLAPMQMLSTERTDPIDKSLGGTYIVGAKKRIIRGTKYAELFLLFRMAENVQGKAKLLTSDGRGSPTPTPQEEGKAGKSDWTYVKEARMSQPKDGDFDIVLEELMPTTKRSTAVFDEANDFSDDNATNNGPYELAKTYKTNDIQDRPYKCESPPHEY